MMSPVRVIQYGLGPIGQACAASILEKESTGQVRLAGAVDIDLEKRGQSVGELLGRTDGRQVKIVPTIAEAIEASGGADVVLHTTSSFLDRVEDQLRACAEAGLHVVSSTEELSYPFLQNPDLAASLEETARQAGVAIVGTGVNPGYVMDTLALVGTGVCTHVRSVSIERIVDAGRRRQPLQNKVGAGLSVAEFEARKAAGGFGHIGLVESAQMVAAGLGWHIADLTEDLQPEVAESAIESPYRTIDAGFVAGIRHVVRVRTTDEQKISLSLRMAVGAYPPSDTIEIDGTPPLQITIPGGIFGDTATVAMLVNSIPRVLEARPGLHTMLSLAVPRAFATAAETTPICI
jgi:2,4-diaminopentanoate dehydrogenase